jgi:hypothetical protein
VGTSPLSSGKTSAIWLINEIAALPFARHPHDPGQFETNAVKRVIKNPVKFYRVIPHTAVAFPRIATRRVQFD